MLVTKAHAEECILRFEIDKVPAMKKADLL